jgi:urease accessory protein
MPWRARLDLEYRIENRRCVARCRHEGPLRVLQPLYPEGDAVCHNVLVHPPGGLVAGDRLDVDIRVGAGAHGLVTTPGAARFYRSDGEAAVQHTRIALESGARFEWLPLEAICYSGCIAENRLELALAPGAEVMGWDVCALGLPAAGQPFVAGRVQQHLELRGAWLERGRLDAARPRLLDSPLGLGGRRCLGTLFFSAGEPLGMDRVEQALEAARGVLGPEGVGLDAGASSPHPQVVVVRVLAPVVEPAMALLKRVRAAWRPLLWQREGAPSRLWAL